MFAIIRVGTKQYKVSSGDVIDVDRLAGDVGKTVTLDNVLLVSDKAVRVGSPNVSGVKVQAKILSHFRGEKVDVRRFKSKVRERKHVGFRPDLTKLEIVSIGRS